MPREAELPVISLCGKTCHKYIFRSLFSMYILKMTAAYIYCFFYQKKIFPGDTVLTKLEEDLRN